MSAGTQIQTYLDSQTEAKTVTEIALDTGVNRATVERNLRNLRKLGDVVEAGEAEGGQKTWRAATQADKDAEDFTIDTDNEDEAEIDAATVVTVDDEGSTVVDTVPDRMTDDEWEASAHVETPAPKEDNNVSTDTVADTAATTEATEAKERAEQKYFHARGGLEAELLAWFEANPDNDEGFSPHKIHKAAGMSGTGAIAYACEALVKKGKLNRTSDKPKRYGYKPESEWPVVEPKETKAQAKAREKAEKALADEAAKAAASE